MAVVTVCTTKCGRPDYQYDIQQKVYIAVCDCGLYRRTGIKHEVKEALRGHIGWRILTWLS